MKHALLPALLLLLASCGRADRVPTIGSGCPDDRAIEAYVSDFSRGIPTSALVADGSMEAARCAQGKLVTRLESSFGRPIGYKVGLTSAPSQERFGVTEPVSGVLLENMMLENGAEVVATFGSRSLYEADLLVLVADSAINEAVDARAVLDHLEAIYPFIELPDLVLGPGQPMDGASITAINVGARLGVVGERIEVDASDELHRSLADMSVVITDDAGEERSREQGRIVLGHPLEAVIWLVRSGVRLKAGDLVSLGSIGPLLTPDAQTTITVTYEGLPGAKPVSVRFQ